MLVGTPKSTSRTNEQRMRVGGRSKRNGWFGAVLPLCLLAALAPMAEAHKVSKAAPGEAFAAGRAQPASTSGLSWGDVERDFDSLLEQELHGDLEQLWSADPALAAQVAILRAGRELPPTISAARREQRELVREETLSWLRAQLASDPVFGEEWSAITTVLLTESERELLWRATARTAGRLQQYGSTREIAKGLESKLPEVVQAARATLFDLYLEWFADAAAFQAFWQRVGESCDGQLYREQALEFEREARELSIKLLKYEPQRAVAWLEAPDPRLRAAAARVLGGAINGDGAQAVALLLERLSQEVDSGAFYAIIEALLEAQADAEPDAASSQELRTRLARVMAGGPADLQSPAAYALGRMNWSLVPDGDDSVLVGISLLAKQVERLSLGGTLTDRDALVTSLQSLWTLGDRMERAGLEPGGGLEAVRLVVLRSIREDREFEGVRVAAARLLPIVGQPQDISIAVNVMKASTTSPELVYTLLADIGEMARGLTAEDPSGALVLDTLLQQLSAEDPDLRRRAVLYLSDEGLARLTSQANPARFIQSLGAETLSELQAQLLALIAKYGHQAQVDQLLQLANFDDIASSGPAGISSLVQTLKQLAEGNPALTLRTAERLLAVNNEGTRVARLREALALVVELDEEGAGALPHEGHYSIVLWARELRQSAGAVPGGQPFLRRLVDVHIPGCFQAQDSGAPNLAHLQALFLTDLVALEPDAGDAAQVREQFEKAWDFAVEFGSDTDQALVLRDRARFYQNQGEDVRALEDYRAVFEAQLIGRAEAGAATPPESVLDLADLRRGGDLISASGTRPASTDETPVASEASTLSESSAAHESLAVSLALIQRAAWTSEPVAVRLQDLRDLAARAIRSRSIEACDLAIPFLAGLPELPPESAEGEPSRAPTPAPPGASWDGLLTDPQVHAELLSLAASLQATRASLQAAKDAVAEPKADATTPEPSTPDESQDESPPSDSNEADSNEAKQQPPAPDDPPTSP